jgi:hypothetical protein
MADIALVTAGRVEVVGLPVRERTYVAGEAINAGAPIVLNTSGAAVHADANDAGPPIRNANIRGIAMRAADSGQPVTVMLEGWLDGYDFTNQAFTTRIFVSDTVGALADAAGTASLPIGYVDVAGANPITAGRDKILHVNIPA